jgi:uroporphyrinogen decarboxylase
MTGRDNLVRTIEHSGPAYMPIHIEFGAAHQREKDSAKVARICALQAQIPRDLMILNPDYIHISPPTAANGITRWRDHWGTGWSDDGNGAKTDFHPLECGYEALSEYVFPDPHGAGLFATANAHLAQRGDRYALGAVWFTLFERLWMLRGFDNMLVDPFVEPDAFADLRDRIVEFNLAIIDQWIARGVNGIYFSDDWGSQQGLLIAPEDWRQYYKPSYARLFQRIREGGAHVWMHLCGNIAAILPDLIEIGLNVLNPIQPRAINIEELARDFGGKVCFFGGADVQGALVYGTPQDVKEQAGLLVRNLRGPQGGYIASTSHGFMPETPLDNVIALYEAFISLRQ